ncbi:MAG TPA: DUF2071 domain-containing protein [Planctomycetaceae bacterium]|nr:DUF2071 domain-containing protein [Planctomycetaceae bacterium]
MRTASTNGVFLTADWRHLLMLNWEIDPAVLEPLVPAGTELDQHDGRTFVSLVGFRFERTRVLGLPVPFHRNFDEVNLRFYVGRDAPDGWRRGVVFIRETVPRWATALVARWMYGERYVACRMRSTITLVDPDQPDARGAVEYTWRGRAEAGECGLRAEMSGTPGFPAAGSHEEFITEHYWGYTARPAGGTLEYQVEHPQWRVWTAYDPQAWGDLSGFYGPVFGRVLAGPPYSAFVADGSRSVVYRGTRLANS